jgi:chromosome segregation ATPase
MADDHFEPEPQTVQDYLRELRRDVKDIKEQTTMTNGRVTQLETWKSEVVAKQRETDAFAAGASTAFLTKKQVGGIVAALGVAASIGSGVATLIARAAG